LASKPGTSEAKEEMNTTQPPLAKFKKKDAYTPLLKQKWKADQEFKTVRRRYENMKFAH
jgi:hypothetical protein